MSEDALVGHTGFVGSNLCTQTFFGSYYNSKSIEDIRGRHFRRLVFAGAQAKKWWANQHPDEDWQGIESALRALSEMSVEESAILVSTVDVVPPQASPDETADCQAPNHPYGSNRLALERAFVEMFDRVLIVRLPALFGNGLKKNVIFDLLTNNLLSEINLLSRFQYYDLSRLWGDIELALAADLSLVHLVTEPIATGSIVERFFPGKAINYDSASAITYNLLTRYAEVFGGQDGYIEPADSVLNRLERFISAWQADARDMAAPR